MLASEIIRGFSLLEILVSLFVISVTAVSITRLQQIVAGQNRDNFIHTAVLVLATEKMEKVLQFEDVTDIEILNGLNESMSEEQTGTKLTLEWAIAMPANEYDAGANVRDVVLQISWNNSQQEAQSFRYSKQVNLINLLDAKSGKASSEAAIIESFIENNEVLYFEPKQGYKKGAFVIYDSELFEAMSNHSAGHGHPRYVADPTAASERWKSYGLINNPALSENVDLEVLF